MENSESTAPTWNETEKASKDMSNFIPYDQHSQNRGQNLLSITLKAYQKDFLPKPYDASKSLTTVLEEIFLDINNSDDRRRQIQDAVSESLNAVCAANSNKIRSSRGRDDFFKNIVNTYATDDETRCMYAHLHLAFRRQKETNYEPSFDDLAVGPYAVIYQMLLLYWQPLRSDNIPTYRRLFLDEAEKYRVGNKFFWKSVMTSSVEVEHALPYPTLEPRGSQEVVFSFDNTANSLWQPRQVGIYPEYMQHERIYPAGAAFEVIAFTKNYLNIHISLKLL